MIQTDMSTTDFENPPEPELKIKKINALAWKKAFPHNNRYRFSFPNILPAEIRRGHSIAITRFANTNSWFNVDAYQRIKIYNTTDGLEWEREGSITLIPGHYKTPKELVNMINTLLEEEIVSDGDLKMAPRFDAIQAQDGSWTCGLFPASFTEEGDPSTRWLPTETTEFNLCIDVPPLICRFLGLNKQFGMKENQFGRNVLKSEAPPDLTPDYTDIQLMSNLSGSPIYTFKRDINVLHSLPEYAWTKMDNIGLTTHRRKSIDFWFETGGRAIGYDNGLINFDIVMKKIVKERHLTTQGIFVDASSGTENVNKPERALDSAEASGISEQPTTQEGHP